MATTPMLVVDNQTETLRTILATLEDTNVTPVVCGSSDDAWQQFQQTAGITRVIVRLQSDTIDGLGLCRQLRSERGRDELTIIALLGESELPLGAEALITGANDLLVDPFEPRELRMRAGIIPNDVQRRFDQPHTLAELCPDVTTEPQLIVPELNRGTLQFGYGPLGHRLEQWQQDPDTRSMTLDRIIVCPKCESIPTFRPGCGSCGSAFVEQQVLIHHFACAHVGPEAEFHSGNGMQCPKCRLSDLIAGSDFEQIKGCLTCTDCQALCTEPATIGHCLNCQHRFEAKDGLLRDLIGYQVGRPTSAASIPPPNYAADTRHATPSAQEM